MLLPLRRQRCAQPAPGEHTGSLAQRPLSVPGGDFVAVGGRETGRTLPLEAAVIIVSGCGARLGCRNGARSETAVDAQRRGARMIDSGDDEAPACINRGVDLQVATAGDAGRRDLDY